MIDAGAPPDPGRRPALGTAFAMAAFLTLAPPLFLLTPLCLLLLFTRPRTGREWFWIVASGAGAAYSLWIVVQSPSTEASIVAAFAVFLGATFAALTHLGRDWSAVSRGISAVIVVAGIIVVWGLQTHFDLASLDSQITAGLRAELTKQFAKAPPSQLNAILAATPAYVRVLPGMLAFQGLIGLGLAWHWYHRIAATPVGPPAKPFADFRFADPLVWGAILTLAASLIPLPPGPSRLAHCMLVVWAGMYAVRGIAVAAATTARWSVPARILLVAVSLFGLPVALGSVIALGLADVWIDVRRRAASHNEGRKPDGSHSS